MQKCWFPFNFWFLSFDFLSFSSAVVLVVVALLDATFTHVSVHKRKILKTGWTCHKLMHDWWPDTWESNSRGQRHPPSLEELFIIEGSKNPRTPIVVVAVVVVAVTVAVPAPVRARVTAVAVAVVVEIVVVGGVLVVLVFLLQLVFVGTVVVEY